MENNSDITQALKDIKNVANNDSWFRGDPHRWAIASLPLAYAVACVEVVSKNSIKAGAVYQQLVEAWGNPGLKTIYEAVIDEVPDSEIEKVKNAFLHPETELLPDPNKPFKQLEEMFTGLEINDDFFKDDDTERVPPIIHAWRLTVNLPLWDLSTHRHARCHHPVKHGGTGDKLKLSSNVLVLPIVQYRLPLVTIEQTSAWRHGGSYPPLPGGQRQGLMDW